MSFSKECVVAVYPKLAEADGAIREFARRGFPMQLVSLVAANLKNEADLEVKPGHCHNALPVECPPTCQGSAQCEWSGACVPKILKYGDEMQKSAAIGGGAGGLLGLVAGTGMLTFAGWENAFLLLPITLTMGIVGAVLGAMFGWGVHSNHLAWYGRKVAERQSLLVVHGDPVQVAQAKGILQATHPLELHQHAETSADDYAIYSRG